MSGQANKAHESSSSLTSLLASIAVLAAAIVPAAILVAAVCYRGLTIGAMIGAAIGAIICWVAGAAALFATFLGNRLRAPVQGMLVGMLFRMGLPLAAVIAVSQWQGARTVSGLTTTILGVYLIALVLETLLAVRMVPPPPSTLRAG